MIVLGLCAVMLAAQVPAEELISKGTVENSSLSPKEIAQGVVTRLHEMQESSLDVRVLDGNEVEIVRATSKMLPDEITTDVYKGGTKVLTYIRSPTSVTEVTPEDRGTYAVTPEQKGDLRYCKALDGCSVGTLLMTWLGPVSRQAEVFRKKIERSSISGEATFENRACYVLTGESVSWSDGAGARTSETLWVTRDFLVVMWATTQEDLVGSDDPRNQKVVSTNTTKRYYRYLESNTKVEGPSAGL